MTIVQQFLGKKISKQEEPLVPCEETPTIKDAEEGKPVVVTMHAHVRRVSSMTTVCVFITALLVLTTGIIGGVYLYRQFSHYKLRHFRGWCSIPLAPEVQDAPKKESLKGSYQSASVPAEDWELVKSTKDKFLEEEVDIDIKTEQYERINVPAFSFGQKARFTHDFVVNKTAIADYENRRCFLMILDRNFILPPRHFYEQVSKMRSGYFDIDTQVVRQSVRVLSPPITDIKNIGVVIVRDCQSMPIYKIERISATAHVVLKRSVDEDSKNTFTEFAGRKIVQTKIVNIDEAIPGPLHS